MREARRKQKMAVLGPFGTHSEAAARYLAARLAARPALAAYPDIYSAIQAVEDGAAQSALVPVENSLEGSVNITLDTLSASQDLCVVRELIWPVRNHLMARCARAEVRRILSHPQPISQCRAYLRAHFPQAEIIETQSTARAAELVAKEPPAAGWAAICTRQAGARLGLLPIAEEIQDNMANATRFFELAKKAGGARAADASKMLVIAKIDGTRPGALYEVLQEFAERGINLTRIESRPARTHLGAYIFFFDLELGDDEAALAASLAAVGRKSIWLKELGAFPVIDASASEPRGKDPGTVAQNDTAMQ